MISVSKEPAFDLRIRDSTLSYSSMKAQNTAWAFNFSTIATEDLTSPRIAVVAPATSMAVFAQRIGCCLPADVRAMPITYTWTPDPVGLATRWPINVAQVTNDEPSASGRLG